MVHCLKPRRLGNHLSFDGQAFNADRVVTMVLQPLSRREWLAANAAGKLLQRCRLWTLDRRRRPFALNARGSLATCSLQRLRLFVPCSTLPLLCFDSGKRGLGFSIVRQVRQAHDVLVGKEHLDIAGVLLPLVHLAVLVLHVFPLVVIFGAQQNRLGLGDSSVRFPGLEAEPLPPACTRPVSRGRHARY